eukprot:TRINITY_DN47856_c0_g1_i1.p1 TRINITY_DN47856_c0_g1~~TRINITY_DN47856_c0_g1_i1.p1  ORF type:complete len:496 (-),score=204.64 TRINITY_DN47856_c0_g1_i1:35-1444(-)
MYTLIPRDFLRLEYWSLSHIVLSHERAVEAAPARRFIVLTHNTNVNTPMSIDGGKVNDSKSREDSEDALCRRRRALHPWVVERSLGWSVRSYPEPNPMDRAWQAELRAGRLVHVLHVVYHSHVCIEHLLAFHRWADETSRAYDPSPPFPLTSIYATGPNRLRVSYSNRTLVKALTFVNVHAVHHASFNEPYVECPVGDTRAVLLHWHWLCRSMLLNSRLGQLAKMVQQAGDTPWGRIEVTKMPSVEQLRVPFDRYTTMAPLVVADLLDPKSDSSNNVNHSANARQLSEGARAAFRDHVLYLMASPHGTSADQMYVSIKLLMDTLTRTPRVTEEIARLLRFEVESLPWVPEELRCDDRWLRVRFMVQLRSVIACNDKMLFAWVTFVQREDKARGLHGCSISVPLRQELETGQIGVQRYGKHHRLRQQQQSVVPLRLVGELGSLSALVDHLRRLGSVDGVMHWLEQHTTHE